MRDRTASALAALARSFDLGDVIAGRVDGSFQLRKLLCDVHAGYA
jgi:hypothetical protein